MAKRKGNGIAVYNLGGITLNDGDETGLFVDSSGGLLISGSMSGTVNVSGIYNSTPPTLTNGQTAELQLDSSARLLVNTAPLSGTSDSVAINDGTNTANVVAGSTGFNGLATASATKTLTFTTSASGVQTILADTDVRGYNWIEVVYTSVGSGLALTGQWSTVSGGTYINVSSWSSSATSVPTQGLGVSSGTYYGSAVRGNFFQIAVSALSSGTFAGTVTLHAVPPPQNAVTINGPVTQSGTWTVGSNSATGSAVPANAFYIAGVNASGNLTGFNTQSTALDAASGNNALQTGEMIYNGSTYDRVRSGGVTGMQGITPQATASGGASFLNIAAGQATTTVKSGAGTLYSIVFNSVATATNTTTIYDNTAASGTVIAIPAATTATVPTTLTFGPAGMAFSTGLTVITATANGSNMTFVYK